MDLRYGSEYEKFRAQVRAFLAENWPLNAYEADLGPKEQAVRFRERAIEHGYLARAVPRKYGGSEQPPDVLRGRIVREEFVRAHAPQDPGTPTSQLIPTLLQHGTEQQRQRYLPPTVKGEQVWCQGYSEPGSGSDLASVQTRGELVGDEWLINGQKIWTSGAHQAQMMYLLCRTEPDAGKHAGISYLLLDMKQPGVEVRPLRHMGGEAHFNEVFLNDARTPADQIVGKRGEGWLVSRSTLQHERGAPSDVERVRSQFEALVNLAKNTLRDGRPAIEHASVRQRILEIEGYVQSQFYSEYRQVTCAGRGDSPGIIVLMNKEILNNIYHMVGRLGLDLVGDGGLQAPKAELGSPADSPGHWVGAFMATRGFAIAGGTANIQRNVIGERGLGLPRDFAAQKAR